MAATSYTNVGVDELRDVITDEIGSPGGPEHFVGTLHNLLLTFVFHPAPAWIPTAPSAGMRTTPTARRSSSTTRTHRRR